MCAQKEKKIVYLLYILDLDSSFFAVVIILLPRGPIVPQELIKYLSIKGRDIMLLADGKIDVFLSRFSVYKHLLVNMLFIIRLHNKVHVSWVGTLRL